MKRIKYLAPLIAGVIVVLSCGTIAGERYIQENKRKQLYEDAVNVLEEEENDSQDVSEAIVIAISNAKYVKPKNIIYMIGDGMGFPIVEATEATYREQLYEGTLAMHCLPTQSSQTTYSMFNEITDSAAGGTALATGFKTTNSIVAMNWDATESYKTVLELAAEKNKSTGIVVTKSVTDATPATFTAHAETRELQDAIAAMQLEKMMDGSLDLMLGGGSSYFEGNANKTLLDKAKEAGVTYVEKWEEAESAKLPLAGLLAEGQLNTALSTTPTIADMTELAIDLLSEDEDGFFLMVEGSLIDIYGHENNLQREMEEVYHFDRAVEVAMKYVAMHPDTVLIVTADHETGGLEIPENLSKNSVQKVNYTSENHTGKAVPLFAVGYGVEIFNKANENTDVAVFIAGLLGEEEFGYKGSLYDLQKTKKKVSFDGEDSTYVVSVDVDKLKLNQEEKIRCLHVNMENLTNREQVIPVLRIICAGEEYEVKPQIDYMGGKESFIVTYNFPEACWLNQTLEDITEFVFTTDGKQANYRFSNIQLRGRIMGR